MEIDDVLLRHACSLVGFAFFIMLAPVDFFFLALSHCVVVVPVFLPHVGEC